MSPRPSEIASVWQVDLDDAGWDRFLHVLNRVEEEKAGRLRTDRLARHYRRCRSVLRLLLARHAGRHPAQVDLRTGWAGKPEAVGLSCHFNVSHCDRRALVAISPYPVGIDVECMANAVVRMEELAGLVCHPDELAALAAMAPQRRDEFLYQLWVQKEAYCKALGTGLQSDLRAVRFEPTRDVAVARVRDAARPGLDGFHVRYWRDPETWAASLCLPVRDGLVATRHLAPDEFAKGAPSMPAH